MTIAPFYISHRPERVLLGCASGTTDPSVETAPLYGGAAHPEQRLLGLGLGGAIAVRVGLTSSGATFVVGHRGVICVLRSLASVFASILVTGISNREQCQDCGRHEGGKF